MSPRGGPDAVVVVVAGATGTGKSTLCGWLSDRGAFVIEADRVGHELLRRPEIAEAIARRFGEDVLDAAGGVDRRVLGPRVFARAEATAALDAIVHPPLVAEIRARIEELRRSRAVTLIVVDAALHFRFEPRIPCDLVVMTTVEPDLQLRRVIQRDGIEESEARDRIERQRDVMEAVARADLCIDTGRSPADCREELFAALDDRLDTRLRASDPEKSRP